ncbi:MAG: hypothetical protein LCH72_12375 [Proteobacteria bacterium]|nr:hypothetical protein [Pseudomonadota bacterium]
MNLLGKAPRPPPMAPAVIASGAAAWRSSERFASTDAALDGRGASP